MANIISDNMRNSVFSENKSFHVHCVMAMPTQNVKTNIGVFEYDYLRAQETMKFEINLDFSQFDVEKHKVEHMAFMFKIIDEKKRIIGNPKKDNMILFVKINT